MIEVHISNFPHKSHDSLAKISQLGYNQTHFFTQLKFDAPPAQRWIEWVLGEASMYLQELAPS